jgi:hypothetical protein
MHLVGVIKEVFDLGILFGDRTASGNARLPRSLVFRHLTLMSGNCNKVVHTKISLTQ